MDDEAPTAGQVVSLVVICFLLAPRLLRLIGTLIGDIARSSIRGRVPPVHRVTHTPRDCSVIVPITNPDSTDLECCLRSILKNNPLYLYIVTVGIEDRDRLERRLNHLRKEFPLIHITVGAVKRRSKRRQIAHAIKSVTTQITVIVDDNVIWPPGFLGGALGPFEHPVLNCITVPKCVRAPLCDSFSTSCWKRLANFQYAYLHLQNRVATAYDFSAIPLGSTVLYRTYALDQVLDEYETEHCYFGRIGALTADEHSFYNLYLLQHDDRFNVPFTPGTSIEVCIYSFSDFIADCERHIRSTWRISANMLTSQQCLRYPWGLYATWLSELASFTLIWDAIIISLFFCLFGMKLVEAIMTMIHMDFRYCDFLGILPLLIVLIPCHYIYTILKIKALLTYQHIEHAEYKKLDRERDKSNEPTWLIGGDSVLRGPPKRQYRGLKNASFIKKQKTVRQV
ncbi:uncharacterized protein NECHADRAFT_75486 [Fusarium vanettenii 77-13-4]|uniref:Ceramide glucosyltransferase n=1 Tax=Fusarium vanettenii (strain ATCC MYA-4622 / CBS 123669 / FGSC 9596 / NRRL 45880 / 77-13-4) TaxID=660122 RepID=C7YIY3_FUSV7|nr:uncharacterized protein NECHADRAFT_75486 [Fusarium vanettenii 77-13-4]EEU48889.1 hypothetical protein NECHADRAFT_75486 [Fusarium vanettenii 77-13-4]